MDQFEEDPVTPLPALDGRDRVAAEFDERLAELWVFLMTFEEEGPLDLGAVGSLLRMAYLRGYEDALSESRRGDLYLRLGLGEPPRRRRIEPNVNHTVSRRRRSK